MNLDPEKIPVTILTGFLGAGKTTLLNRVLTEQSGGKFAVVVNEFGEIGIDADLIVAADDEIIEMTNGCVCCTIRGDLLEALDSLLKRFQKLDGILIETTGLADPAPVIQTFFLDDDLTDRISLDAVVTVVDAFHLISSLSENPEVAGQIALADVIVLNKLDLVEPGVLAETESRLRALNNRANILRSERCAVPLANILGLAAFSFYALLEREPEFLESAPLQHNQHGLTSLSLSSARPIDPDDFIEWMRNIIRSYGSDLLRSKGVLAFPDEPRRFVFHGVQALQDGDFHGEWSPGEERMSRLVLIGRHLVHDELRAGFEACIAPPARKSATYPVK